MLQLGAKTSVTPVRRWYRPVIRLARVGEHAGLT
jgi:hypothetical protein